MQLRSCLCVKLLAILLMAGPVCLLAGRIAVPDSPAPSAVLERSRGRCDVRAVPSAADEATRAIRPCLPEVTCLLQLSHRFHAPGCLIPAFITQSPTKVE